MNFQAWMGLPDETAEALVEELTKIAPDPASTYTPASNDREVAFNMGKRAVVVELVNHLRRLRQERAEQQEPETRLY